MNYDGAVKIISVTCCDDEEKMKVGNLIHKQLVGNQDYINCNIILNIDEPNTVNLFFFEECENIPTILI